MPFTATTRDSNDPDHFRLELRTDISRVGDVVETVRSRCFDRDVPSPRAQFRLCTVLAEAVANAMLYGNGGDPARHVIIEVDFQDDRFVIAVSDEGDGFDHSAIPLPICDESRAATRGRGLFMIHRLAEGVHFNDRGNTIWMTLPRR
ncbi:MAG TPA: ATP-binding protein [Gemmatimonadales bacterium]|jgi:serine/threonine-protein kinase RsbW